MYKIGMIKVNDRPVEVVEGDTFASCMMRAGILVHRRLGSGEPRGLYCAMGICNDCLVIVDGIRNVRACLTMAWPGASVETQDVRQW